MGYQIRQQWHTLRGPAVGDVELAGGFVVFRQGTAIQPDNLAHLLHRRYDFGVNVRREKMNETRRKIREHAFEFQQRFKFRVWQLRNKLVHDPPSLFFPWIGKRWS